MIMIWQMREIKRLSFFPKEGFLVFREKRQKILEEFR